MTGVRKLWVLCSGLRGLQAVSGSDLLIGLLGLWATRRACFSLGAWGVGLGASGSAVAVSRVALVILGCN